MNAQLKQEERQAALSVKQAKKKLEIRRKDVLRADTSARAEIQYGQQVCAVTVQHPCPAT